MAKNNLERRLAHPTVKNFVKDHLPTIQSLYTPEQVWLFGSFAHGKPNRWSDLDVVVVSKKFARGKKLSRRSRFLKKTNLRSGFQIVVDPLLYTPTEFERWKNAPTIISEVVKTGIRLI